MWFLIAAFVAVVLNPAVEWLVARFHLRRGLATGIVFGAELAGILGALLAVPVAGIIQVEGRDI